MLSEAGAPQAEGVIPLCVPYLNGSEWAYVKQCLDTNWVSSVGSFVDQFEAGVARFLGASQAVAVVNGTAALHVALLVAGVEPDDEVLISDLTFIAPANAIAYAGAWPVFIDAEPDYWQLDTDKVRHFLENDCEWRGNVLRNKTTRRRIKALVPVDILGHPVDYDPLLELARQYELAIVEDATESLGASYRGTMAGRLGHISALSFNGNKLMTTGAGGMIVTDRADWGSRARYLTTTAKDDPVEYIHGAVGFNYRLSNVQAAIGCAQLEQLEGFIAKKLAIAERYREGLERLPGIRLMAQAPWAKSTFWLYTIRLNEAEAGLDSRALLRRLDEAGIQTRPLWEPMHLSKAHPGAVRTPCPVSEQLNRECLSLPSSVGLTVDDQKRVIAAIRGAVLRE